MERSIAASGHRESGHPGRAGCIDRTTRILVLACALALPVGLGLPGALAAQEETSQAAAQAAQDTTAAVAGLAADTVPADTLPTPRQRALERLRAMRVDPVQPDTAVRDTADGSPEDDGFNPLLPGPLPIPVDTARADPADPADGATPADTASRITDLVAPTPGELAELPDTAVLVTDDTPVDVDRLAGDSVMALLRSLSGYTVREYRGDAAVFHAETEQLELRGNPRVGQGRDAMEADSLLVYDGRTGVVCGYGNPVLSGERDPIVSDEVCFDTERSLGVAVGARTTFQQGATWYVRGARNRVYLLTGGERNALYGERAEFTSCDLDHPHYLFKARSLKMVEGEMMVARNITLEFDDVPVFWLPWMVQSMKRDRRSGLLMPEFGVNDIVRNSSGYNRNISNLGFYWAINDYASAKGTFEWYSNHWTAVEGAVTYRWLRQFLQGNITTKQYWRQQEGSAGRREFTLNTSNSWQPDERTRLQLNANYATSTEFVRDNSFDPRELNRKITSSASVNRSFGWGTMSVGADRNEQLSTGQIDWKLPGVSVNISPVTLYHGDGGSDLTWNGSGGLTRRTRHLPDPLGALGSDALTANYGQSISFGKLGLSQRVNWSEDVRQGPVAAGPLPAFPGNQPVGLPTHTVDNLGRGFALGEESTERLDWSSSLSYQQVLWAGTVVSPNLSFSGTQVRDERTRGDFLAEPNRISAGASLNTSVYGFWPGFGDFSRIRHKVAPAVQWSYSPAPEFTQLQEEVFGVRNLREQNRLTLSFSQTFEAKVREPAPTDTATARDGAMDQGSDAAGEAAADRADGEPRRLPRAEKVLLLALDTRTPLVYDFVAAAEDGRGFLTDQISNSIRSDLLRGFQLTTTHSLFETGPVPEPGAMPARTFAPFLTSLAASFSIDDSFWLFEFLGLSSTARGPAGPGGSAGGPRDPDAEGVAGSDDPRVGAEADPDGTAGMGSVIPNRGPQEGGVRQGVGGWRASLNYSLNRTRADGTGTGSADSQLLSGNISFQPTPLWSLRWSTAYSFTDGEFANHVLTLTRDLHRWQANFDFVKAQNGNFAMRFRVQLRDNPDLKLDYDQRTDRSDRGRSGLTGAVQ